MNYNSTQILSWARAVKERDGSACTVCGSTRDLHAHHVKPKSLFPSLALDVSNGVTLCVDCHANEHADDEKTRRIITAPRTARGATRRVTLVRDLKVDEYVDGTVGACATCGELFVGRHDAVYCSGRCRQTAHRAAKKGAESRTSSLERRDSD